MIGRITAPATGDDRTDDCACGGMILLVSNLFRKLRFQMIADIRQALAATRHLLEMYRRGLPEEKTRRRLQRLDRRLLDVAVQLDRITTAEK